MAHIVMKKWHPKYFHFLKLCVLLSDDIFLFVFQVDSDFFRALFSSFCRKKLPTSKAHLKAQTSNFFSFSTAHVDLTSEMFEPPKISGHVRTCEKSRHVEFQHGHLLHSNMFAATPWATHCHWRSSGRARPLPVKTVETS